MITVRAWVDRDAVAANRNDNGGRPVLRFVFAGERPTCVWAAQSLSGSGPWKLVCDPEHPDMRDLASVWLEFELEMPDGVLKYT